MRFFTWIYLYWKTAVVKDWPLELLLGRSKTVQFGVWLRQILPQWFHLLARITNSYHCSQTLSEMEEICSACPFPPLLQKQQCLTSISSTAGLPVNQVTILLHSSSRGACTYQLHWQNRRRQSTDLNAVRRPWRRHPVSVLGWGWEKGRAETPQFWTWPALSWRHTKCFIPKV